MSSALALGCIEITDDTSDQGSGGKIAISTGGSTAAAGSSSTGGSNSVSDPGASHAGSGGKSVDPTPNSGGTESSAGGAAPTGGTAGTTNEPPSSGGTTVGSGGETTTSGGIPSSGGETAASGGTTTVSGGTTATGGSEASAGTISSGGTAGQSAAQGGSTAAGGSTADPVENEVLCLDGNGDAIPYDYTVGVATQYAAAIFEGCDLGGYMLPLVMADPEGLSQVNAFVMDLTDWYRADILRCADAHTDLGTDEFGLLPASETGDLSEADSDAATALFISVLSSKDGQADGVSAETKRKIEARLKSKGKQAVKNENKELTKPLVPPDCGPAEGAPGNGASG